MADDSSGEKTEKPTARKLREARRKGDVPKSRDLGLGLGLIAALLAVWQLVRLAPPRLAALLDAALEASAERDFAESLAAVGAEAVSAALVLSALVLVPVSFVGLLALFLQTGPILALEKLAPKLSNLDPVAGTKRMFGADSLVECVKAVLLSAILLGISAYVTVDNLGEFLRTPHATPTAFVAAMLDGAMQLVLWTLGAFAFFTALDLAWQHSSFEKKMMMSQQDIKEEHKNAEGDPQMKGERKRLARQWSGEGAKKAASGATVLVVNPVHVAIAVLYDERTTPVPKVIGRGEDELALEMRAAAEAAEVPVLRNELLARTLLKDTRDGDLVPRELFAVVAEVTLWALRARARLERERRGEPEPRTAALPVPGEEDLTRYNEPS